MKVYVFKRIPCVLFMQLSCGMVVRGGQQTICKKKKVNRPKRPSFGPYLCLVFLCRLGRCDIAALC
jgi:hypothetical protein